MPNTARVIRSIPFWVLVGGSLVAVGGGVYLLVDKLTVMASTLADGTATGVEVYAGQIWAVLGAILIGVGLIGLALALTLGTIGSIARGVTPSVVAEEIDVVEVVEPATVAAPVAETVAAPVSDADESAQAPGASHRLIAHRTTRRRRSSRGPAPSSSDQNGSSGSIAMATNRSVRYVIDAWKTRIGRICSPRTARL
jgi:multisubunit Na+/H+ antiporter MnhC subunit